LIAGVELKGRNLINIEVGEEQGGIWVGKIKP
jgi:hypothetical protein